MRLSFLPFSGNIAPLKKAKAINTFHPPEPHQVYQPTSSFPPLNKAVRHGSLHVQRSGKLATRSFRCIQAINQHLVWLYGLQRVVHLVVIVTLSPDPDPSDGMAFSRSSSPYNQLRRTPHRTATVFLDCSYRSISDPNPAACGAITHGSSHTTWQVIRLVSAECYDCRLRWVRYLGKSLN